ncbi:MAG: Rieske (2Fe-2S) protein [Thermomicrobiales bacterium]|nr:Rieske (2Fe-2S) protein [Thermomicrobiales bacterium]
MPDAPGNRHHRDWRPVATTDELEAADRKIVAIDGESVGIFKVNGEYVAILNVCPHEFAPVCLGRVGGTTLASAPGQWIWGREGEILACPWHGWEFELRTGKALFGRRPRLRLFPVKVEDNTIFVSLVGSFRPGA